MNCLSLGRYQIPDSCSVGIQSRFKLADKGHIDHRWQQAAPIIDENQYAGLSKAVYVFQISEWL